MVHSHIEVKCKVKCCNSNFKRNRFKWMYVRNNTQHKKLVSFNHKKAIDMHTSIQLAKNGNVFVKIQNILIIN